MTTGEAPTLLLGTIGETLPDDAAAAVAAAPRARALTTAGASHLPITVRSDQLMSRVIGLIPQRDLTAKGAKNAKEPCREPAIRSGTHQR